MSVIKLFHLTELQHLYKRQKSSLEFVLRQAYPMCLPRCGSSRIKPQSEYDDGVIKPSRFTKRFLLQKRLFWINLLHAQACKHGQSLPQKDKGARGCLLTQQMLLSSFVWRSDLQSQNGQSCPTSVPQSCHCGRTQNNSNRQTLTYQSV